MPADGVDSADACGHDSSRADGVPGDDSTFPASSTIIDPVPGFFDRLRQASRARGSLLCVGLDPDPERIPGGAAGALRRCVEVVEATAEHACCYKPNSAFWEQYGPDGWKALLELRDAIPPGVPVLLDAKRADIGSTMTAYARAIFDVLGADAVTAWPYVGGDALAELT